MKIRTHRPNNLSRSGASWIILDYLCDEIRWLGLRILWDFSVWKWVLASWRRLCSSSLFRYLISTSSRSVHTHLWLWTNLANGMQSKWNPGKYCGKNSKALEIINRSEWTFLTKSTSNFIKLLHGGRDFLFTVIGHKQNNQEDWRKGSVNKYFYFAMERLQTCKHEFIIILKCDTLIDETRNVYSIAIMFYPSKQSTFCVSETWDGKGFSVLLPCISIPLFPLDWVEIQFAWNRSLTTFLEGSVVANDFWRICALMSQLVSRMSWWCEQHKLSFMVQWTSQGNYWNSLFIVARS